MGVVENENPVNLIKQLTGGWVDSVAATVDNSDNLAWRCWIAGQMGSVEEPGPNDGCELVGVTVEGLWVSFGDCVEEALCLFDEPIPALGHRRVGDRVGHAQQRVVDDLVDDGARGGQLVGLDGVIGFGVTDDMDDVGGESHGGAGGGGELS